ncbi:selenoneine biosynthesis selenosugar synthase SenB [Aestuariirhabdus sp. LZHN29]|uniref:selenoneine biosynthesis selenosugar synthase SenB n=1 Tax=Aestuariirhabdus sp. LZHN29 TaxID=3417462 RepID=UPI003CE9B751
MRIILITPAATKSKAGNRATATRWAHIFRSLGHQVRVATHYEGQDADLMVALHAWRSADAATAYRAKYPDRPLIVAITGTDAYRFIHTDPEMTLGTIELADHLVGLHDLIANALPPAQRHKVHVIYQSAEPIGQRHPYQRYFHVSVLGHLRAEKDPLRPALAARLLPDSSRIHIHHYGKAHTPDWADKAHAEMAINPRYTWHGESAHFEVRRVYQRTQLLVLPSVMEGGANVISEAVVAGVPVIASEIEGSVGLLGKDYPGYYPVGDEAALSALLLRVESEPLFYQALQRAALAKRGRFTAEGETLAWQALLSQV